MMDMQRRINREASVRRRSEGLGWLGIALGLAQLLFARRITHVLGMAGEEGLVRLYGLRQVANGVGLIAAREPGPWLWARVAGDAVDMATLAANAQDNPRRSSVALALGAVAGLTALDVMAAQAAGELGQLKAKLLAPDYGDRSGFPQDALAMRGAAAKDFEAPRDFRIPEAMQPWEEPPPQPPSVH